MYRRAYCCTLYMTENAENTLFTQKADTPVIYGIRFVFSLHQSSFKILYTFFRESGISDNLFYRLTIRYHIPGNFNIPL